VGRYSINASGECSDDDEKELGLKAHELLSSAPGLESGSFYGAVASFTLPNPPVPPAAPDVAAGEVTAEAEDG